MPNQTTTRPPTAARGDGSTGVVERRVVTVFLVLLAVALAALSSRGPIPAAIGVLFAGFIAALAIIGRERMAMLAMVGAFATAPMYKGLTPSPDTPVTPTDLLFGLAIAMLLPTLIGRPARLPLTYVIGTLIILVTGTLSTVFSPAPFISALQFVQWLVVLVGLVCLLAIWSPGWRRVDILLWSYVAGHVASVAWMPIDDGYGGRHVGLTHHPNAFGEAGVMAFAALMYLWGRSNALWYRAVVLVAAAASVVSVLESGSRAATVVVAGLVLMFPFVERSALKGVVFSVLLALGVALLPFVLDAAGEGSALSRLQGSKDVVGADAARNRAQEFGIQMFLDHPITGGGFAETIYVHDVLLGVAASIGVIGLLGYLLVLYTLARPIIGTHPHRRICYLAWAFIAITPTVPALDDRTLWVPMAPVILVAMNMPAARGRWGSKADQEPDQGPESEPTAEPVAELKSEPQGA